MLENKIKGQCSLDLRATRSTNNGSKNILQ